MLPSSLRDRASSHCCSDTQTVARDTKFLAGKTFVENINWWHMSIATLLRPSCCTSTKLPVHSHCMAITQDSLEFSVRCPQASWLPCHAKACWVYNRPLQLRVLSSAQGSSSLSSHDTAGRFLPCSSSWIPHHALLFTHAPCTPCQQSHSRRFK